MRGLFVRDGKQRNKVTLPGVLQSEWVLGCRMSGLRGRVYRGE
jgi:hypothetical protein